MFTTRRPVRSFSFMCGVVLVLFGATPLHAQDDWFAEDKAKHFFASAGIAAGGFAVGATLFDCKVPGALLGGGLSLSAGIVKEWMDSRGNGQASWKDMAWNLAGIAVGLGVMWKVDDSDRHCSPSTPTRSLEDRGVGRIGASPLPALRHPLGPAWPPDPHPTSALRAR